MSIRAFAGTPRQRLGKVGRPQEAQAALQLHRDDDDDWVRDTITEALQRLSAVGQDANPAQ